MLILCETLTCVMKLEKYKINLYLHQRRHCGTDKHHSLLKKKRKHLLLLFFANSSNQNKYNECKNETEKNVIIYETIINIPVMSMTYRVLHYLLVYSIVLSSVKLLHL